MGPPDLARLVIDGIEHSAVGDAIVRTSPTLCSVLGLSEIDTVANAGTHDKQPGFGVEAGRPVIGKAAFIRRDQAAIGRRIFFGIRNRLALLVDTQRPVRRTKRNGQETFTGGAIEHEEIAIARGLHEHFAGLSMKHTVHQYGISTASQSWVSCGEG